MKGYPSLLVTLMLSRSRSKYFQKCLDNEVSFYLDRTIGELKMAIDGTDQGVLAQCDELKEPGQMLSLGGYL